MDMTASIEARSDQINADDLIGGPQTFTIRDVIGGKAEAPFDFMLVETERAYRPNKTMRRIIVAAWGKDTAAYAGRRLTLYREPTIVFGGKTVGGIRISHMSHIDGAVDVMAQVTRGKREKFVVQPLPDAPAEHRASRPDPIAVMAAGMTARGMVDNEDRLAYVESVVGRAISSPSEMTPKEVAKVNEALARPIADVTEGELVEEPS